MHNAKLRQVFEDLGYGAVSSVATSGNLVFKSASADAAALEQQIEAALSQSLGIPGKTIVRSLADLEKLLRKDPFKGLEDTKSSNLNVTFLKRRSAAKIDFPVGDDSRAYTVLGYYDRAVFSALDLTNRRYPRLVGWLEKTYSKDITTRTWKAVQRIVKTMQAA